MAGLWLGCSDRLLPPIYHLPHFSCRLQSPRLQVRSTGKALPKRLTTHQRQIVGRLLAAHGDDIAAMARDRKLNAMQHSEGVLRALVESYKHWKEGSGVDFRVPHKRLW